MEQYVKGFQRFQRLQVFTIYFNLLQSATSVITKCDSFFYYKVRQVLLQSATGITKCDDYYKVRQYMVGFDTPVNLLAHKGIFYSMAKRRRG